jgi:hypothetical protein
MELTAIAKKLQAAAAEECPEDIFGGPADGSGVRPAYKQLLALIHPDHFVDNPKEFELANKLLTALTNLKGAADRKIKAGTYGNKKVKAEPRRIPFSPMVIEARGQRYTLTMQVASGDLCELYAGYVGDNVIDLQLFKVTRDGANNDLAEAEARILGKLYPPTAKDEKFHRFLPKMRDSFIISGPGYQRRVNVMSWFPEHRGLDEVMRVFPDGIDFRDMVWMFKRILHGIGHAHESKIVHGAILPPHIMIHPVNHGAKIVDWSYAVELDPEPAKPLKATKGKTASYYDILKTDEFGTHPHVSAISNEYRDYYPPEVLNRETPTPATDIFMAARMCMVLIGGDPKKPTVPDVLPEPVAKFFRSCLEILPAKRPQHAWDAHEQLDKILLSAVGKRKYRPFPMPKRG